MNIKIFEKSYLFPKSRPHPTPSLFTATHTTLSIQINTNNFLFNQVLFFFFFFTVSTDLCTFCLDHLHGFLYRLSTSFFLIKLKKNFFFNYFIKLSFSLNFLFWIGVQPIKNVVIVSREQQRDSPHTYMYPLSPKLCPSRLPDYIEQSFLSYTVGPWRLSILNITVSICPNY